MPCRSIAFRSKARPIHRTRVQLLCAARPHSSRERVHFARGNAAKHEVQERVEFLQGDLLDAVPVDRQFDLVVSNPPYIGTGEVGTVDEFVQKFEPEIALFSGEKGTDAIERLVEQAKTRLKPGGYLVFETSPIIFDACLEIVNQTGAFGEPESIKDYSGHLRIVCACRA